jgi:hypothetical protein
VAALLGYVSTIKPQQILEAAEGPGDRDSPHRAASVAAGDALIAPRSLQRHSFRY